MDKYRNKYRIKSARANWHDYNGGIYFITICTKNRAHYFGEIIFPNSELESGLESESESVQTGHAPSLQNLQDSQDSQDSQNFEYPQIFPYLQHSEIAKYTDDCIQNIENHHPYAKILEYIIMPNHLHILIEINTENSKRTIKSDNLDDSNKNEKMQDISKRKGLLSVAIGSMKSAITKYANANEIEFGWQERFHDHIVRNEVEFERIKNYIINNPKNWKDDKFF